MPQLKDPHFEQTVVLMLPMPGNGDIGLVLNRDMGITLDSILLDDQPIPEGIKKMPLSYGGPVTPEHIIFLTEGPEQPEQTVKIGQNIYLGCTLEFVATKRHEVGWNFRAYCGYSGWSPNQLDSELTTVSWMTLPFNSDLIFKTKTSEIWSKAIKLLGFDPNQLSSDPTFTLQ